MCATACKICERFFLCYWLCLLLQARHREEIEQIRKAGHDSLAMIVEQYKVLLSYAVPCHLVSDVM